MGWQKRRLHDNRDLLIISRSQTIKPIKNLWGDLSGAVHRRHPANLTDSERFGKEERKNTAK